MNQMATATSTLDNSMVILPFEVVCKERIIHLFVNVQKILKVVELSELSSLPQSGNVFSGMLDFNRTPVPVLDFSNWLENNSYIHQDTSTQPSLAFQQNKRIIIVEALGKTLGLIIHKTKKVERITNLQILSPPNSLKTQESQLINGVIAEGKLFRYMLDIESLLSLLGIIVATFDGKSAKSDEPLKGKKLLIVEDSRMFQKIAVEVLGKYGAEITLANDGVEGLKILLSPQGQFDLIIADVEMPQMNGIEMIRQYKAKSPSPAPILFHSAISNQNLINDILKEGLGDYITKFDEQTIVHKAFSLLHKQRLTP